MKSSLKSRRNPHIKSHRHSVFNTGKTVLSWILLGGVALVIAAVIVVAGGIWFSRDANEQAQEEIAEEVQRRNRPTEPVYNQASLGQKSNHSIDQDMVNHYSKADSQFIDHVTYNSKKDVAKVTLKKSAANDIKYASKSKKMNKKLTRSLRTGIQIDTQLSNQAVEIANKAHDGYFTFQFANANGYQAPDTKTGNFNV